MKAAWALTRSRIAAWFGSAVLTLRPWKHLTFREHPKRKKPGSLR